MCVEVTNGIVIIHVADPPKVTLSLGSTLNPDEIKEGDDVYFECHIKANPKENRISWSHDVSSYESIESLWRRTRSERTPEEDNNLLNSHAKENLFAKGPRKQFE